MSKQLVVLHVARDGLTQILTTSGLAIYGYDVVTASDGATAVDLMRTRRIDVLVTDAELGGEVDGLKVARLARELHPKVEVIYTARFPQKLSEQMKVRGAPSIRSPYHPHQIASVIAALKHRVVSDEYGQVA
jgi:DNA-binding response OmpR family regulator